MYHLPQKQNKFCPKINSLESEKKFENISAEIYCPNFYSLKIIVSSEKGERIEDFSFHHIKCAKRTICKFRLIDKIPKENLIKSARKIHGMITSHFCSTKTMLYATHLFNHLYFQSNGILSIPLPTQSPDLNTIENARRYMKNMMNKRPRKNKQEF